MVEQYELLYIIPAKHTDEEVAKLTEKISGLLTGAGAKITENRNLGKQKLAYPIQHTRYGHYVLNYFESETPVVAKLNEMLRLSTDILRHLIVSRDLKITKAPTLINYDTLHAEREEEVRPMAAVAAVRPVQAAVKVDDKVIMDDLDKKLDDILTEEVK